MFKSPEINYVLEQTTEQREQVTVEKTDFSLSNKNDNVNSELQEDTSDNIDSETDMSVQSKKREKRKIMSIKEDDIANVKLLIDFNDNQFQRITDKKLRKILIKGKKGRVVAHAKWQNGDINVTKIRRPGLTNLEEGQVLYESDPYGINEPWPSPPEIETKGWLLYRNKDYNNEQAIRKDPYWKNYRGWFVIPEEINGKNGMEVLLETYPEFQKMGYEVKKSSEIDVDRLKMVQWKDIDACVCGRRDEPPELLDFKIPKKEEMICSNAATCWCGCGRFEYWSLYYPNHWIVYEPRKEITNGSCEA